MHVLHVRKVFFLSLLLAISLLLFTNLELIGAQDSGVTPAETPTLEPSLLPTETTFPVDTTVPTATETSLPTPTPTASETLVFPLK
jgi:hypothetical protein